MLLIKYYISLFTQITGELLLIGLFLLAVALQRLITYFGA